MLELFLLIKCLIGFFIFMMWEKWMGYLVSKDVWE